MSIESYSKHHIHDNIITQIASQSQLMFTSIYVTLKYKTNTRLRSYSLHCMEEGGKHGWCVVTLMKSLTRTKNGGSQAEARKIDGWF